MIDPRTAERLAREVFAAYEDAETRIAATIARLVARGLTEESYSLTWARGKAEEIVSLRRQVQAILDNLDRSTPEQVIAALVKARSLGVADAKSDLVRAGISTAFEVATDRRSVASIAAATTRTLAGTHLLIMRTSDDVYRDAVAAAARGVATGIETRRAASQRVLDTFADRGVTGFIDGAGRNWNLASYAEMAMRSTTGQTAVQGALDGYVAADRDLVIVSDSPEECELCRPWEGRVLSITGKTAGYPTVADAAAAGLWHPGCTHTVGLWVPGLSRRMQGTANPQGYDDRQEQRYLERGVRQWKRREAVALDDAAKRRAAAKTREWQGRLREHVDATGMQRLPYREQVRKAI